MDAERTTSAPPRIHPTALVDRTANLGPGVTVGPLAVVGPGVSIGEGTTIEAHAVIERGVVVGRDNVVGAGVVLGCRPQHRKFGDEHSTLIVGDRNVFGEYATVSRGFGDGTQTEIGSDGYIMSYVRIDHNCRIGNAVTITSGAGLGGHVTVDDGAYVGGNGGVHQFVRVGRLAMVGAVSMVRQDVPPYVLAAGVPARAHSLNVVGLRRAGLPQIHRRALRRAFTLLYLRGLTVSAAVEAIAAELGDDPYITHLLEFLRSGSHNRGFVRWTRDSHSD
jgi:UDP-N-acetylglucosamine acyltransferase